MFSAWKLTDIHEKREDLEDISDERRGSLLYREHSSSVCVKHSWIQCKILHRTQWTKVKFTLLLILSVTVVVGLLQPWHICFGSAKLYMDIGPKYLREIKPVYNSTAWYTAFVSSLFGVQGRFCGFVSLLPDGGFYSIGIHLLRLLTPCGLTFFTSSNWKELDIR